MNPQSESLKEFYNRVPAANHLNLSLNNAGAGHFNVFLREACAFLTPYSRRDYYKVSLIIGTGKLHYADKWIEIDRPALLFLTQLFLTPGKLNLKFKKDGSVFLQRLLYSLAKIKASYSNHHFSK